MDGKEKLIAMQQSIKDMTPEERRKKVVKLENKKELKKVIDIEKSSNGYIILPHGKKDFYDMNVVFNNVKTKEEIESMIDTEGAIKEINWVIEQKSIELADDLDYLFQFVTISDPGCVVTTDCYKKKYGKEDIELTENDCLDDIACVSIHYTATDERRECDYADFEDYYGDSRLVHFNDFCKEIEKMGYDIEFLNTTPGQNPFNDYLHELNENGLIDISVPRLSKKDSIKR